MTKYSTSSLLIKSTPKDEVWKENERTGHIPSHLAGCRPDLAAAPGHDVDLHDPPLPIEGSVSCPSGSSRVVNRPERTS